MPQRYHYCELFKKSSPKDMFSFISEREEWGDRNIKVRNIDQLPHVCALDSYQSHSYDQHWCNRPACGPHWGQRAPGWEAPKCLGSTYCFRFIMQEIISMCDRTNGQRTPGTKTLMPHNWPQWDLWPHLGTWQYKPGSMIWTHEKLLTITL